MRHDAADPWWRRIVVDVAGSDLEARPPAQHGFDYPDTECDGWSTPALTMRYATVRGERHRFYQQPRQDAVRAAAQHATGAIVFAVADGVSSAAYAEMGAIEACRAAVEKMLHLLSTDHFLDLRQVMCHASDRLHERAQWLLHGRQPLPAEVPALCATTLVAGVVQPAVDGAVVQLCRIGDSGAWLLDRDSGRYNPLFGSKTGSDKAMVAGTVATLPFIAEGLESATARLVPGMALLAGTDGFGDPLGDGDGQVGELFSHDLAEPPSPLRLAHLLDFSRETFDDDRTLLAIWPRPGSGAP